MNSRSLRFRVAIRFSSLGNGNRRGALLSRQSLSAPAVEIGKANCWSTGPATDERGGRPQRTRGSAPSVALVQGAGREPGRERRAARMGDEREAAVGEPARHSLRKHECSEGAWRSRGRQHKHSCRGMHENPPPASHKYWPTETTTFVLLPGRCIRRFSSRCFLTSR